MTNDDARALEPGDRIRLKPQPTWSTNPPQRITYTVAKIDFRKGYSEPRIVSVEGFRFTPWEVERFEGENPMKEAKIAPGGVQREIEPSTKRRGWLARLFFGEE